MSTENDDLMLVKILKADKEKWYADLVGIVLCVRREILHDFHEVFPTTMRWGSIRDDDCEEVFAVGKDVFERLVGHNLAVGPVLIGSSEISVDQFAGANNHTLLEVSPPCANHYIPDPLPPQVYKIPTPHPSRWTGAYVVSNHKVFTEIGSIPAGTIFQFDGGYRITANKHLKSVPCSGCGVSFRYTFNGSRKAFLERFYFVQCSDEAPEPLTQAILLGDKDATKE